ncbi:hypothetical protein AB0I53_36850 [Saccharopolyspora sp. NPDC050389]|uniref:hypothetical protein n=1 Tax=Saccharopolyspora sp. NPDC050389 TaxID=3155516 RepID=UPI0033F6ECD9
MAELLDLERRLSKLIEQIRDCSLMEVEFCAEGDLDPERVDAAGVLADVADWYEVLLDASLEPAVTRFEELACHWSIDEPDVELSGEFSLIYLLDAFGNTPPRLAHAGTPDAERRLFSEFRVFDEPHRGGDGKLVSLRVQDGVTNPEVWFFDVTRGTYRLDVDYRGYLDALLLTRGTYGWQYLFTDVSLRDSEFEHVAEDMRLMLRTFPPLFPDDDFTPLRARLSERLG